MVRMADILPKTARAGAEQWGWVEHTSDWQEVTRAPDIDVVVIITPNGSHADIAIDALEHGKHVLCEKPLANSVEAAERMAKSAHTSGRVAMINFAYRTRPAVELARQLVGEGEIGDVLQISGRFLQDCAADPNLSFSWRFDRNAAGGRAFMDIGSLITETACTLRDRSRASRHAPYKFTDSARVLPVARQ